MRTKDTWLIFIINSNKRRELSADGRTQHVTASKEYFKKMFPRHPLSNLTLAICQGSAPSLRGSIVERSFFYWQFVSMDKLNLCARGWLPPRDQSVRASGYANAREESVTVGLFKTLETLKTESQTLFIWHLIAWNSEYIGAHIGVLPFAPFVSIERARCFHMSLSGAFNQKFVTVATKVSGNLRVSSWWTVCS